MPTAIACGILMDGQRMLFLSRKTSDGIEEICLPCVEVRKGEDSVGAATVEFHRATGIDGYVSGAAFTGEHNCGTRKRKAWIPALGFKIEAKNMKAAPSSEFSGAKWLEYDDAKKLRIAKNSIWILSASKKSESPKSDPR